MWKVSFRAGPSFKPMYFIIMSLRSKRSAFPSISCNKRRKKEKWYLVQSKKYIWTQIVVVHRVHSEATVHQLHRAKFKFTFSNAEHSYFKHLHCCEWIHTCFLKRSACGARTGSISLIYCMTSSTVHKLGSWPLGLGLSRKLPEPEETQTQIHRSINYSYFGGTGFKELGHCKNSQELFELFLGFRV